MTDSIFITGVVIHARHGVMEHETEVGQRFVIGNRGGGGTTIGTLQMAKSAPNGYTLGIVDPAFIECDVRKTG